ncbi:MAG: FIST C-terminal domain-containing protein, partial [Anaerolineales bacterium]|nr:FIST C-terminal domain-containing protein [Anaerolineales bacterium]
LVGCSTAGEIHDEFVYDNSLAVALVQMEASRVQVATVAVNRDSDAKAAGQALIESLKASDLRGVFVLADGLSINGSDLIAGINSQLPPGVTVTGGLAGDGPHFKTTWVMHNDVISSGMIAAVGFYGERIVLDHGSQGGWDIFGPERLVTRADGPILYELDGKPALELYKTYLGERAAELPAAALLFPLALRNDASDESQIVRTILAIDEAQQSLTFAGNIPEGSRAQLMKANFDRLIDGALGAAEQLDSQQACQGDKLAIAISCVGRRLVLGERTEEELEATLETLPAGTKQIGFYSYGELSPFGSGQCDLHNQTMTLTTISEV